MKLTFEKAIEILEITEISEIKIEDIPQIEKKAKKRWHPDKVIHLNNPSTTNEYTTNFQSIEEAGQMVRSFLNGSYQAGESFSSPHQSVNEEPEEIIRKNAPEIQESLRNLWDLIKEKKYKWTVQEVLLSDGYKLKDLIAEDYKEDLAKLSIVSFFYGIFTLSILVAIGSSISPAIGMIISFVWFAHAIACILGFAPLSRFWLPESISDIMIKFINFGLSIYNWAEDRIKHSSNTWLILLVRIPLIFANLVKYIILFPLTEIAKMVVGDKVVGVVSQNVNYYADGAEWYIEELIGKNPNEMDKEELFNLSYLYSELSDVKHNI